MESTVTNPCPIRGFKLEDIGCRLTWEEMVPVMSTCPTGFRMYEYLSASNQYTWKGLAQPLNDPTIIAGHETDDDYDIDLRMCVGF